MRKYDHSQPLIVIHIPKAAGTTSQKIFERWFGEGFLKHYYNERTGSMPPKYDLSEMHSREKPILVHGHFNKLRQFGVEDYYPEVKQFITILRDPFELTVSRYFFTSKNAWRWKDQSRAPKGDAIEYLLNIKPNMLNQFPREMSMQNYRDVMDEYFIEIGITEHLDRSMKRIARKLNMPFESAWLGRFNTTKRDQEIPGDLRDLFMRKHQLEFAVYDYALSKYA